MADTDTPSTSSSYGSQHHWPTRWVRFTRNGTRYSDTVHAAIRARIPAGYSFENWTPGEQPLFLMGSVFDPDSIGKWIFDFAAYVHGPDSPIADVAADLWLLFIKLAGRSETLKKRIEQYRSRQGHDGLQRMTRNVHKLWRKIQYLIKDCEEGMWDHVREDRDGISWLDQPAGIAFTRSLLHRGHHLERTEKLMTEIRVWIMICDSGLE